MSHVDDGTLHAYLDGELETVRPGASAALEAHVAACGECRARLEEERRIRDRARAILDHAAPVGVEVPPFDVVLGRARGDAGSAATTPRPRRPWTLPLAWAASVVLALAGGWWAHEMVRAPEYAALRHEVLESADADDAVPSSVPVSTSSGEAATAGNPTPPTAATGKPSLTGQVEPARDPSAREEARRARLAAGATTAPSVTQGGAAAEDERPRGAPPQARAVAALRAGDSGGAAAAQAKVAGTDAVRSDAVAPAPDAVRWSAVDRAEAERRLGGRLFLVEGLETESIEIADGGGLPVVRTRQAVAPGTTLVLIQQATTPGAAVGLPLLAHPEGDASGPARVSVQRNGFLVLLVADLPLDSLRALAERLR